MQRKQQGFTLVEIAIVIVVIGLLVGGVLKGQELITQARIKNIAGDLNAVSAAIYGYQDRYRKLPGDDEQAAERWKDKTTAGNGGGAIDTATAFLECAGADKAKENCLFWQHLRLAGFFAGDTGSTSAPQNASGGPMQVQNGALGLTGLVVCTANLTGKIAAALDVQFDDGKPASGQFRATSAGALDKLKDGESTYIEDGTVSYAACKAL